MIFEGKGLNKNSFEGIEPLSKVDTRCIVENSAIKYKGRVYASPYLQDYNKKGVSVHEDGEKVICVHQDNEGDEYMDTICKFEL